MNSPHPRKLRAWFGEPRLTAAVHGRHHAASPSCDSDIAVLHANHLRAIERRNRLNQILRHQPIGVCHRHVRQLAAVKREQKVDIALTQTVIGWHGANPKVSNRMLPAGSAAICAVANSRMSL